ncbi:MAG: hypothetical protein ACJLS3_07845 [Erythrobacter sp.]
MNGESVGPDSGKLPLTTAVRILHRVLKWRLVDQEPAPWVTVPADPIDAEHDNVAYRHRLTLRTAFTMQRALLAGDLTAFAKAESGFSPLPGWVWESEKASWDAMMFGWLRISPIWEHDLSSVGSVRCFIARDSFKERLAKLQTTDIGDLPQVPKAFDCEARPAIAVYRQPPDRPFVDLTTALTWIGFCLALNHDELAAAMDLAQGPFAVIGWPDVLRTAVRRFAEQASAGRIAVRGRYVSHYANHTEAARANTVYLTDAQLRDFARFESLHGGLERGEGLAWEDDDIADIFVARDDGWRDVEVNRADLMRVFPASQRPIAKDKTRRKPGPQADPDWPFAVDAVTRECVAAGYTKQLRRGDKAAITTMLLSFMADKDKHFSPDAAAKYAEAVITQLPDN